MRDTLLDLLELVKDKEFIKDMKYKVNHAKRDAEIRGDILGEYYEELGGDIIDKINEEAEFRINGTAVYNFEYYEHTDEYTFYDVFDSSLATCKGKIANHDDYEDYEELLVELSKIFGDAE